ncbi:hypothetical protein [Collimonas arenae]|uniref:hypothetical protein n=1 Tax=Collimonas arenae TaxID=279058 RepID=UPI0007787D9B|nr:hypothetical protein [Collimonas arenae]
MTNKNFEIDLNQPGELTKANIAALVATGDDSVHTQIRVSKVGKLYVSETVGSKEIDDLLFRLETNTAGNGYVGPDAAKNTARIDRLYKVIKANWPVPSSTYIDDF